MQELTKMSFLVKVQESLRINAFLVYARTFILELAMSYAWEFEDNFFSRQSENNSRIDNITYYLTEDSLISLQIFGSILKL